MSISLALIIFTHLISFMGFTTLAITGEVGAVTIAMFYSTLILSYINDRYKKNYQFSQRASNAIALVMLVYILLSVSYLGREIFQGILNFLIFIQIIRHLSYKGMREIIQIYLISFFQFMAGAILSIEISYGLVLIIYVFVALGALIIYNLKKESDDAGVKPDKTVINRSFVGSSIALALFIIFISITLFLILPRLKTEYFSSTFISPKVLKTGFSDTVKLGRVGEIKKDHSAVMRVSIIDGREFIDDILYWRGIALEHFDGTTWSVDSDRYGNYERRHRKNRYGMIRVKDDAKKVITHEIITEPNDTDILFAINSPVAYTGPSGSFRSYSGWIYEVNSSYFLPFHPRQRIKYRAFSEIKKQRADELNSEPELYSYYIKDRYLQLPNISDEIKNISQEITENESTAYGKTRAILRYLLEEMNYTITLESGTKEFPLETFLIEKKQGHCEYFATAMVVLLRLNGIPSRIVNGFIGGTWNEHGNFYLVRESDAHSWVEVYFPNQGWITFDPTPGSNRINTDSGHITAIMAYIDYLKFRWQRYVIDFSRNDQSRMFASARQKISWNKNKVFNKIGKGNKNNKNLVVFIAVISALIIIIYSSGWFNKNKLLSVNSDNPITKIYNKSIKQMSKKGLIKQDYQTAKEFSDFVISEGGPEYKIFEQFTHKYSQMRYTGRYTKADISLLNNLLAEIKKIKSKSY